MTDAASRYDDGGGSDPLPVVLEALGGSGRDGEAIEIDDPAGADEFHALGWSATMALPSRRASSRTRTWSTSAPGGPARSTASRLGARVTAVESVTRFRDACAELNRRAGLGDAIRTGESSATQLPLADGSMDVAWKQAVAIGQRSFTPTVDPRA